MRIRLLALTSTLAIQLSSRAAAQTVRQSCPSVAADTVTRAWNPASLPGEYVVTRISDSASHRTQRWRLFLWRTSMLDSSTEKHVHPLANDTAMHVAYGAFVVDTGRWTSARRGELRRGIDPIYPPVVVMALRGWPAVLLIGTSSNARDAYPDVDGTGVGMWIHEMTAQGFRGTYQPWGILITDRGRYCADKVM